MIREHNKKLNNLEVFYLTQPAFLVGFIEVFCFFFHLGDDFAEVLNFICYFFGRVAFKIKAKNPAGINPVVSNSLNLIPKSGM